MPATGWTGMAASRRGTSHVRRGEPRQDARQVRHAHGSDTIVAVVADGAGSAPQGGTGAAVICRRIAAQAVEALNRLAVAEIDEDQVRDWIDAARDVLGAGAARRGRSLRDYATTLLLAISDGWRTVVAHVGDGAIVARRAGGGGWEALSWPATGEYASTTYFVTDEPAPNVRIGIHDGAIDGLALFTDGIERLVLDLANRAPHQSWFDRMAAPLDRMAARADQGESIDFELSQALGRYLDGDRVCERSDDDKTVVLSVRARRDAVDGDERGTAASEAGDG